MTTGSKMFAALSALALAALVAVAVFTGDHCPDNAWCDDGEVSLSPSDIPDWLLRISETATVEHRRLFYEDPKIAPQSLAQVNDRIENSLAGAPAGVTEITITRPKHDAVATMFTYKDSHFVVATWNEEYKPPETHTTCNGPLYCTTGPAGHPAPKSSRTQWFFNGRWMSTLPGGLDGFAKALEEQPEY